MPTIAADPLSEYLPDELRSLGVFWLPDTPAPNFAPGVGGRGGPVAPRQSVILTRLRVRYDNAHFPEDLVFQETGDRANFQGRYVLRHPWTGAEICGAATEYRQALLDRRGREAEQLARLTGWTIADIRKKMGTDLPVRAEPAWWERLWKK